MDDTAIAQEVLASMVREGVELSEDIGQAEIALRDRMQRIAAKALEQHLNGRRLGYEGSYRPCPCGGRQRFVEHRRKILQTCVGTIEFRRAYYRCSCGTSCLPYDEKIKLGAGQVSPGLAKSAALLGTQEPFESAARMLHELTGQRLSESTIERLTEQVGAKVAEAEQAQAARIRSWDAPAAEHHPDTLYVAVDGVMVRENDGFHEAKTVTCYWDTPDGKRESRYRVRFESAAEFATFVWALACRCGAKMAQQIVLLADGAKWIWEHVAPLLEGAICIVDWYHALEHLWTCGRALHGEQTPETTMWVKTLEALLWDGHVREIVRRLENELKRTRAPDKRVAIEVLVTYLKNQDDRLAYDKFRERGLDIGSGRVEAACKNVVAVRMKRSSMRWSRYGSQSTLSLRVAWINAQWDQVWEGKPLAA
jgi:hypothetical protein